MDNKNKIIGIITLIVVILVAVLAFFHMAGYHTSDLGASNANVPTEVASPPNGDNASLNK